jgi:protein-S-isoprenylcysteine O-methyltransferase Ste14
MAGEIWSAVALGVSYSPMLRVADEHAIVSAGPYRWIRHPLYTFWLPVTVGWGAATRNWLIIVSGAALAFVLAVVRVPREEAMMLQGFGQLYRNYMARTGRFTPKLRTALTK